MFSKSCYMLVIYKSENFSTFGKLKYSKYKSWEHCFTYVTCGQKGPFKKALKIQKTLKISWLITFTEINFLFLQKIKANNRSDLWIRNAFIEFSTFSYVFCQSYEIWTKVHLTKKRPCLAEFNIQCGNLRISMPFRF